MKLGLGTVQFGMPYGVSNQIGQTTEAEVGRILYAAASAGVRVLDTAALYGESESVLGRLLPARHSFKIVTKLPGLLNHAGIFDEGEANRLLERSLTNLRQSSLYGLMLHRPDELLQSPEGERMMRWLESVRSEGTTTKVGISIYEEAQLAWMLAKYGGSFDLVQGPVNLFDQRLLHSDSLKRCRGLGVEVHARSVFLQGLLLMAPADVPPYFAPYAERFRMLHRFLRREDISALAAALAFVRDRDEIDAVICGVNDCRQLADLIACMQQDNDGPPSRDYSPLAASELNLLNPAMWQL